MNSSRNQTILFYVLLGAVTALFLLLLKPFFYSIFWAAVTASVFMPLYKRINARMRSPSVSALLMIILVALIIVLPASILGSLLLQQSVQLYDALNADSSSFRGSIQDLMNTFAGNSLLKLLPLEKSYWIERFAEIARSIANYIFVNLTALTQNTLAFFAKFAVMFYTLFFFFRDGDKFLNMAMRIIPLGNGREKILYKRFAAAARSTLKTTLIIGGLQGVLGGLIFFATGIEGSLIWGLVMVISAIIPVVGCSIIWAPAGILMLLTGHVWEGILILVFGAIVISTVDNLLRPFLIGKDVKMHPLLIFLSTLGGIVLFGFSGFVLGPIITALLLAIWEMYDQYYEGDVTRD